MAKTVDVPLSGLNLRQFHPRWSAGLANSDQLVDCNRLEACFLSRNITATIIERKTEFLADEALSFLSLLLESSRHFFDSGGLRVAAPLSHLICPCLMILYRVEVSSRARIVALLRESFAPFVEIATKNAIESLDQATLDPVELTALMHVMVAGGDPPAEAFDILRTLEKSFSLEAEPNRYNKACVSSILLLLPGEDDLRRLGVAEALRHLAVCKSSTYWRKYDPDLDPLREIVRKYPEWDALARAAGLFA